MFSLSDVAFTCPHRVFFSFLFTHLQHSTHNYVLKEKTHTQRQKLKAHSSLITVVHPPSQQQQTHLPAGSPSPRRLPVSPPAPRLPAGSPSPCRLPISLAPGPRPPTPPFHGSPWLHTLRGNRALGPAARCVKPAQATQGLPIRRSKPRSSHFIVGLMPAGYL